MVEFTKEEEKLMDDAQRRWERRKKRQEKENSKFLKQLRDVTEKEKG